MMKNNKTSTSSIRITLTAIFMLAIMVGCKKTTDNYESSITLSQSAIDVSFGGSERSIEILANKSWQAQTDVNWIEFKSVSYGEKGKSIFSFIVLENQEEGSRSGIITFVTDDGYTAELLIEQQGSSGSDLYVKVDGNGDGSSWSAATTLDDALAQANEGNVIHIAEGIYIPSIVIRGGNDSDDGDKTFLIDKNITLIGGYPANVNDIEAEPNPAQYETILSGNMSSYHVMLISLPDGTDANDKVVLQGLTITKSSSTVDDATAVTINGVNFQRRKGGGIAVAKANLDIIDCKVIENVAGQSGGIFATNNVNLNIIRSSISDNIGNHHAGGMWFDGNVSASIFDSEINNNIANQAGVCGGIYAFTNCTVNIYNSVISGNKTVSSHGGGLYYRNNSKGVIVNSMITNNETNGDGGGIFLYDNCEIDLISSTVTGNHANGRTGGIYYRVGVNRLSIFNSIISGNSQDGNNEEVLAGDTNSPPANFHGSIISKITYNTNGDEETAANDFDFQIMLTDMGGGIFAPSVNPNNPANTYGFSVSQLTDLGNNVDPVVDNEIIANDIHHNTRENKNVMGAVSP